MKLAIAVREEHKDVPMASELVEVAEKWNIPIYKQGDKIPKYDWVLNFNNKGTPLKTKSKVAWWMCDFRHTSERPQAKADLIFLCNNHLKEEYEKYYKAPVYYMPQYGLNIKKIKKGRPINWDVIFIGILGAGLHHNNRAKLITEIGNKEKISVIQGEKYTKDQRWIYNQTPFSLQISIPREGYTSNRLYNILSSKGFCLTSYFPGLEKLFKNHKHLVWFKNGQEVKEIIDYYLEHPEEYEKVKENGFKQYKKKHTAERRLKNIIDILEGKTNKFYGYEHFN